MRNWWFSNLNGFRGSEVLVRIRRGNIVSKYIVKLFLKSPGKMGGEKENLLKRK